ncbi:MAG: hypothetical protein JXA66_04355 [Oligoflexia bacterium]|nr:hypothetical protein [Oligoflexia bacterium]
MKYVFCVIVTALLTYFVTVYFVRSQAPRVEEVKGLLEADINEYLLLNDEGEKIKKAEYMLVKIMHVFMPGSDIRFADRGKTKKLQARKEKGTDGSSGVYRAVARTEPVIAADGWVDNEKNIENLDTVDDISQFLESVRIKDLYAEFARKREITNINRNNATASLLGRYVGEITKDGVKLYDVSTNFEAVDEEGSSLNYEISIRGKGPIGNSLTSGEHSYAGNVLSEILSEVENGSRALFIEVRKNNTYIQLYYLDQTGSFIGNVYQNDNGVFNVIGVINLEPA